MDNKVLEKGLDDLKSGFEEFKQKNDERLEQLEKGSEDVITKEHVDRINEDLSKKLDTLKEAFDQVEKDQKAEQERAEKLEKLLARMPTGTTERDAEHALTVGQQLKSFNALIKEVDKAKEADAESLIAYNENFEHALRRGKLTPDQEKALAVGQDPDGGYWVSPDKSGEIVKIVHETSPIRQQCSVVQIGTDALEGTRDLQQGAASWVTELESRTESSTPQIEVWRIPVHELHAQPAATQKMLDDAQFDVEGWLADKTAEAFMLAENTAFVSGTGVGKPRGFTTYAAGVPSSTTFEVIEQVGTGTSAAFDATTPGDVFHTTIGKMKQPYLAACRWGMNRTTLAETRKIKDGDGTYLWEKSFQANQPFILLGYPVDMFEDMAAIAGNSLSIAFANWRRAYTVVDRIGIRVLRDPYTSKPKVLFDTTKRVGGDVTNFEAIKLIKFG